MTNDSAPHDGHGECPNDARPPMLRLTTAGDREIWLDLSTGREIEQPITAPQREELVMYPPEPAPIDAVIAAVEGNGWHYTRLDDGVITLPVRGRRSSYDALVVANSEFHYVTMYCTFGPRVPEDRRAAVAEAITRANFGLVVGSFEMDFSDGELRFRVGIALEGGAFSAEMAGHMFSLALYMCDRYHDALMRVIFAGEPPDEAIQTAETT